MKLFFGFIEKYLDFCPSIDLFASRINGATPSIFCSRPDEKSEVIIAICVSWHNLSFYCFPPFSHIGKVLQKIVSDNASGILMSQTGPASFGLSSYKDYYWQRHLSFHLMQIFYIYQINLISNILLLRIWNWWYVWCQEKLWHTV